MTDQPQEPIRLQDVVIPRPAGAIQAVIIDGHLIAVCVRCNVREGTMELSNGDIICTDCYAEAADTTYDRLRDRENGQ